MILSLNRFRLEMTDSHRAAADQDLVDSIDMPPPLKSFFGDRTRARAPEASASLPKTSTSAPATQANKFFPFT